MKTAAELVRDSRERAGLSMRGLAARAGVAYTTVQRIEQGVMDPTVGMLGKLLMAVGEELDLATSVLEFPEIADLADAWHTDNAGQEWPDFTRLRAFLDYLSWHGEVKGPATMRAPSQSGSEFMDNVLAAMAEKTCDDAGLPRPAWTKKVAPMSEPVSPTGTPRMQQKTRDETPTQFEARGIFLSEFDLWRREPLRA